MQIPIYLLLSLSLASFAAAAGTCTSAGSISWPPVGDCSNGGTKYPTAVQTCRACCLNDGPCLTKCYKEAGIGPNVVSSRSVGASKEKRLTSRAIDLSCGTNENCYKYTDGSLLCLNLGTGKFAIFPPEVAQILTECLLGVYHDDVGGTGSYFSGEYTGPDGKVQTGTSAGTATVGSGTSSAKSQFTGGTSTRPVGASGATNVVSSAAAAASSTVASTGDGDMLRVGANIGLVGLVAGLVL